MLLRLRSIARLYGPRLIFRDLSLDVCEGEITLLAGANGAGKSTLLKIMAGLARPSSGEVERPDGPNGGEAHIAYLGHQTFLYPDLSALENLRFWSAMHRLPLADADFVDMLRRVELSPFAEEKARHFSRGMAQRLNLARVFLQRPDILLLDEPATGLDIRSASVLHREIASASASGAGVVWITHTLADDLPRAHRVAVLENKRLGFYGTVDEYLAWSLQQQEGSARVAAPFAPDSAAQGGELC